MRMASSGVNHGRPSSTALFACSKCFSRHPFEELSLGQQLCKECRGSFPVVKCTYCRSEFQQESKSSTSSICKKCEVNVQKYGKPSSCQFCSIIAAFVSGKCHRCHDSYRKYGAPKTCEQCKQKCAFDKEDKRNLDGKLLCWLCSLSYKRALVRTKQSDPARHSRVFKADKDAQKEKEKKQRRERDKYFNHKKPQRPDVTKIRSPDEPLPKISKLAKDKRKERDDTDHVAEITQLKEKIASMQKTITVKNNELLQKQGEMTAIKAKLFNEEKLIKEKMKKLQRYHDDKVAGLQQKIQSLQNELAKAKRDASKNDSVPLRRNKELFPGAKKKDLISTSTYRPKDQPDPKGKKQKRETHDIKDRGRGSERGTDSPATAESRSQSASPAPGTLSASLSGDKGIHGQRYRSRSRSVSRSPRSRSKSVEQGERSRTGSPYETSLNNKEMGHDSTSISRTSRSQSPETEHIRERTNNTHGGSRSSSPEPMENNGRDNEQQRSYHTLRSRSKSRSSSRSRSRSISQSPSRSRSPSSPMSRNSSNSSPKRDEYVIEDSE